MRGIGDGDDIPIFIAPDIFGSGNYKYKYNGKEYQDELNLIGMTIKPETMTLL